MSVSPASSYAFSAWLFLRLLGFVYFAAFWSIAGQSPGLIGSDGILPAREYLSEVEAWTDAAGVGIDRYRLVPTVFWIAASDRALQAAAYGGAVLGLLLALGIAPAALLVLLWLGYLSIAVVSGDFLSYQWDALLLEAGFLAIYLAPPVLRDRWRDARDPPRLARWLLWWLLFRLMFASGLVKLVSGDPVWRDLTALAFHYETQPLPTPVAWYAAAFPLAVDRVATLVTLGIELLVPWLIFTRWRCAAAVVLVALQALIAITGNFAFFNLLTIALCLLLCEDRVFRKPEGFRLPVVRLPVVRHRSDRVVGNTIGSRRPSGLRSAGLRSVWIRWAPVAATMLTLPVSAAVFAGQLGIAVPLAEPVRELVAPFRSVNAYGLFAVMTTRRLEIEVEGSLDGVTWIPYVFPHKPGPLDRRPSWIAPMQPRLDWQMWFAALSRYEEEFWFQRFERKLLDGSPAVLALLQRDPFDGTHPRFVRSTLYEYRFTDWRSGRATGAWWTRRRVRPYGAAPRLKPALDPAP